MISLLLALGAVVLGAVLKGAIGAGLPVIAAPAITMLYDVQTAVAVLVLPNMASNFWQAWYFRKQALPPRFLWWFAGAGIAGVLFGTWLLIVLSQEILSLLVAGAVIFYIGLRVGRPGWVLSRDLGQRLSGAGGFLGGLLQGAAGLSGPVSLSFLNAMRLSRDCFIGTIAIFFIAISAAQIPALWGVGILTGERLLLGLAVTAIAYAVMPLGGWLGRRASPRVFDITMLVVLGLIAARILYDTLL